MGSRLHELEIHEIDIYVGTRIRDRRTMLGLTQRQLAAKIGVTYQQAHKYEHGVNRVSAGRLYEIAEALDIPVGYFYEGLNSHSEKERGPDHPRMRLELARNFTIIKNGKHQEALSHLARALAETAQETSH